jgi:hypothetical protein
MNALDYRQCEEKDQTWNNYNPKVLNLGPPERKRFVKGGIKYPRGEEPDRNAHRESAKREAYLRATFTNKRHDS